MVTATSKVDICNLALTLLLNDGQPVVDIDNPKSKEEVLCSRWFDVMRLSTLRVMSWNFALKRTTLTADVTAPVFGFTRAFNLPIDWVRTVSLFVPDDNTALRPTIDYVSENKQLLIDADATATLNLLYVFDQTQVTKFDALFIEILALQLAIRMAYDFSSDKTLTQQLIAYLEDRITGAKAIDSQEQPPIRVERSRSRQVRRELGSQNILRFE